MSVQLITYPKQSDAKVVNFSPFCSKTEVTLRMLGVNYDLVLFKDDPKKAPKGKLPYIVCEGEVIADSHFIEDYIREKFGKDLDTEYSDYEKAIIFSTKKMIEEYLYWCVIQNRWIDPRNSDKTKKTFFGHIPGLLRAVVWNVSNKKVKKNLAGHGMGKHSTEDIHLLADKCLKSLSDILGEKLYFMGDNFSSLDASAYGLLENIFFSDINPEMKALAQKYENLAIYTKNLNDYFLKLKRVN